MADETNASRNAAGGAPRKWTAAIGPGLITASVVIGPGSLLTSSKVGATFGYSMMWVLVVAAALMMVYMMLGARLGVLSGHSAGDWVTRLAGRWLAALIGVSVFFISAAFQFGNNLGVHSAIEIYAEKFEIKHYEYGIVIFNALSLAFLFGFKNLYRVIERMMMMFVGVMLLSFAVNLMFARPLLSELVKGFVPTLPRGEAGKADLLPVIGWIGTTFVISAAYYQSYLVRQKGWGKAELQEGLIDARVGSVILAFITLMITTTSSAVLRGAKLENVGDVAKQLEPLFGQWGQGLFCLGLFCAAYSSFLVNSMIGGFILSDGLGIGSDPKDFWPRIFTAAVLMVGMGVGLLVIKRGWNPVPAIVAAQAVTVIAAPLMAGTLWWLTNRRDVMGEHRNGIITNIAAGLGFLILVVIAVNVASNKVWPAVVGWIDGGS